MSSSAKNLLIRIFGPDRPGITATLMQKIRDAKITVSDMGQSVTQGILSLSILLEGPFEEKDSSELLSKLLFEAKNHGVELEYLWLDPKEEDSFQKDSQYILTVVHDEKISTNFLEELATGISKRSINIVGIKNVSPKGLRCLEMTLSIESRTLAKELKADLGKLTEPHQVDLALMREGVFRKNKRVVVLDMDSTLIQTEVIDEIANLAGIKEKVSQITQRAMNGELDFADALRERVSLLKGIPFEKLEALCPALPLTPGVRPFIKAVKKLGYKIALISGGFDLFVNHFKEELELDYAFANQLEVENGVLTGEVIGPLVDASQKAALIQLIAQQEKISLDQVVAIGDGANDIPMLQTAGLGIAFHAKEKVKKEASQQISFGPMNSLLYFLGIPEDFDRSELC